MTGCRGQTQPGGRGVMRREKRPRTKYRRAMCEVRCVWSWRCSVRRRMRRGGGTSGVRWAAGAHTQGGCIIRCGDACFVFRCYVCPISARLNHVDLDVRFLMRSTRSKPQGVRHTGHSSLSPRPPRRRAPRVGGGQRT
eukprot:3814623-Prymnesium_polylepis.1